MTIDNDRDPVGAFIEAACVPMNDWHGGGSLERAEAIRAANPDLAARSVYAAAALGEAEAIGQHIAIDPTAATAKGGPRGWDALTCLCFSRYLHLDPTRSAGFVAAARALLDAGADPNTGWFEKGHGEQKGEWEPVLYGAAGIAHHGGLARLLVERGANPNDGEVAYHAPETRNNEALRALVEIGKPNADSMATMLLRKADWHDGDGVRYLLEHGADPNRMTVWGRTALHQAILRDNAIATIETLLDHRADPAVTMNGASAAALAARRGRGAVLALFERRGFVPPLAGADRLLAACARNDAEGIHRVSGEDPSALKQLLANGGAPLAEFAGVGNTDGVRHLLDLGVPVTAPYAEGDGYFGIPRGSLAIHVAAWRAWPATVKLLLERGSPVNAPDANGRTPLALAVRACVDSYWTERRTAESVHALIQAGASKNGITVPTGYAEIDALLRAPSS